MGKIQLKQAAILLFDKFGFDRFNNENALKITEYMNLKHMCNFGYIQDVNKNGQWFEFIKNPNRVNSEIYKNNIKDLNDIEDKIISLAHERGLLEKIGGKTIEHDHRLSLLLIEMDLKTRNLL